MEWEDYDRYTFMELKNLGIYNFDNYLKDICNSFSFKNKEEENNFLKKNKKFFKQCFDNNLDYNKAIQNLKI